MTCMPSDFPLPIKKPYEKWLVILKKILIKEVISFAECHWLIFFGAFLLNNVVSRIGFAVEKSCSWTDILSWRQCWSYRFLEFWGLAMENSSLFLPCVFTNLWFWQLLMIASFCYPFYTSWIQWGPQRFKGKFWISLGAQEPVPGHLVAWERSTQTSVFWPDPFQIGSDLLVTACCSLSSLISSDLQSLIRQLGVFECHSV